MATKVDQLAAERVEILAFRDIQSLDRLIRAGRSMMREAMSESERQLVEYVGTAEEAAALSEHVRSMVVLYIMHTWNERG